MKSHLMRPLSIMVSVKPSLALVAAGIGCALLLTMPISYAENTKVYSNKEYRFSFKYPAAWSMQAPTTQNTKAKVVSPSSALTAECVVTVKRVSQLDAINQADLDQLLLNSPPDREQYQATLMQGFSDVSVVAVSQGRLGSRIAHMVRARYSVRNESAKDFVSVRMAKAFSPGLSWSLTCGGQGASPDEAESAYDYWQSAINNIFISFRFPHESSKPKESVVHQSRNDKLVDNYFNDVSASADDLNDPYFGEQPEEDPLKKYRTTLGSSTTYPKAVYKCWLDNLTGVESRAAAIGIKRACIELHKESE